ncbi:L-ascorbate peroxidase S, chloroplastic/mitochondrial [Tetrabaena socialis]|uniref:L-ascorbate peroxidase S, chloroplastic/mitochondrial n=1 Tax=Tetrabaena socialis TaxID=47790 RepID=A0A2J7ZLV0_9CHLO|nr:L-ascorbate peroxidase S, chloroplastic/mitochondrial [Tetrabaena socialis]|eukprot:PNH01230.1 L-ascorbate peroxidase S, chloroplastic/mitochondrial [Tetrabaena socialis]
MRASVMPSNCRCMARPPAARHARATAVRVRAAVNVEQLKACRQELMTYVNSKGFNPIAVRLAWHDAGTYDKNVSEWPARGGANASIRFKPESGHGSNAGLTVAIGLLAPIQKKFPEVSFADLRAVHLPAASNAVAPPPSGARTPSQRSSGVASTKYTAVGPGVSTASPSGRPDRPVTPKPVGQVGQSWTVNWLEFDNSYFTEIKTKRDSDLVVLPTDACIFEDEGFRVYAEKYAADNDLFFADYAVSHQKLSELGVEWEEGGPVTL